MCPITVILKTFGYCHKSVKSTGASYISRVCQYIRHTIVVILELSLGILVVAAPISAGIRSLAIGTDIVTGNSNSMVEGGGVEFSTVGSLAGAHSVAAGMSSKELVVALTSGWPPPTIGASPSPIMAANPKSSASVGDREPGSSRILSDGVCCWAALALLRVSMPPLKSAAQLPAGAWPM